METENTPWMQTNLGKKFHPLNVKPSEILLDDIIHSLSLICRFNGHCTSHYSVAQHSVLVSRKCPEPYKLYGLLHDAAEAYMSDIVNPYKHIELYRPIRQYEDKLLDIILNKYNVFIDDKAKKIVHEIDKRILLTEKKSLMTVQLHWSLEEKYEPYDEIITPWTFEKSQLEFYKDFNQLYFKN